jgi:hypothetical protein
MLIKVGCVFCVMVFCNQLLDRFLDLIDNPADPVTMILIGLSTVLMGLLLLKGVG